MCRKLRDRAGGREASRERAGKWSSGQGGSSAGVEKTHSKDATKQQGLAWGQPGEQRTSDRNLREAKTGCNQRSPDLEGADMKLKVPLSPACPLPGHMQPLPLL